MIRKPGAEDFRENPAIVAMRESKKIAIEGSKGIGQGMARLYLYFIAVMMGFGFLASLLSSLDGIGGLLVIGVGAFGYNQWRLNQQMRRQMATRYGDYYPDSRFDQPHPDSFAFPPQVRREGSVELNIGAVAQQVAVLFISGFVVMLVFGRGDSSIAMVFGIVLVTLSVLVGARLFGHRKAIEWDQTSVTVWHLLGEGRMQWSDVADVTVEKSSRLNFATYFKSGSSRNIVLIAPVNRLGGPNRLLVPIRLTALDERGLEELLRDLFCWRAAGMSLGGFVEEPSVPHRPFSRNPAYLEPQAPQPRPFPQNDAPDSSAPEAVFDPDAIMERYMRDRDRTLAGQAQEREEIYAQQAQARAAVRGPQRAGGFGRKGL